MEKKRTGYSGAKKVNTLAREKSGATAIGEPIGNRKIRIMVQNRLLHGQLAESSDQYSGSIIGDRLHVPCTDLYPK
jgi:hypothetical protein